MDCQVEEVEIKIEYIESVDIDPLSNTCVRIEESAGNTSEFECITVSQEYLSPVNLLHDEVNKSIVTWYKCIDGTGIYQCRFCELTYATVQSLRYHTYLKHSVEAEQLKNTVSNNKRMKKPKCHICKESFKVVTDLKKHFVMAHKTANNSCHICRAVFNSKNTLSYHLVSQHKILLSKLFFCNICGYRTGRVSHFKQHTKTHFESKTEKCSHCNYTTHYLPNLRAHENIHNDKRSYECNFRTCDYKGSSHAALRSHHLVHFRENNFIYCDKCTFKTVYKQSLKKHMSSHDRNSIKSNYI